MGVRVLQFVNSFVGRPGNIGVRTGRVLNVLAEQGGGGTCVCRGAQVRAPGVSYAEMGWLGHVPRLLNAARIYLAPGFNHRRADIALFQWFCRRHLPSLLASEREAAVAHVWDVCPQLIRSLQAAGRRVLLDVPIAPLTYGMRLQSEGLAPFLLNDARQRDLELAAFAYADGLIAPSRFVATELVRAGVDEGKVNVVEFGVDIPERSAGERRGDSAAGLRFCFAGTINRRKGIPELLAAWSHRDFAGDELHLCGRVFPEVREYLAAATGGKVVTPGFVDTFSYLAGCDVFVFPSWLEGSAKAVFEAMACGLPVIVTHSTGSVVRDGVEGFVIDAGDVEALRNRMLWFRENRDGRLAMGRAAQARAREFSWHRYAERIMACYGEMLSVPA